MYDDFDYALEDAFDEGYYQALIDMGIDPDDIAEEDVDIFDDNYFDAMEGNPQNKIKRQAYDREMSGEDLHAYRLGTRNGSQWDRNVYRRTKDPVKSLSREFINDAAGGNPRILAKSGSADRRTDAAMRARRNLDYRKERGLINPSDGSKIYRDRKYREERTTANNVAKRREEARYGDGFVYFN